jgi:hypothetical protein
MRVNSSSRPIAISIWVGGVVWVALVSGATAYYLRHSGSAEPMVWSAALIALVFPFLVVAALTASRAHSRGFDRSRGPETNREHRPASRADDDGDDAPPRTP